MNKKALLYTILIFIFTAAITILSCVYHSILFAAIPLIIIAIFNIFYAIYTIIEFEMRK
jgi:hypothetical protein